MLGHEAHAAYQRHFEVGEAARRLKEALQPGTPPVSERLPTASTVS